MWQDYFGTGTRTATTLEWDHCLPVWKLMSYTKSDCNVDIAALAQTSRFLLLPGFQFKMQNINPHGVSKALLVRVSTGQEKTAMKFVADSSASLRSAREHCVQSYHLQSVQHTVPHTVVLFTCSWRPPRPWIGPWPCCVQDQLLP